MILFTLLATLVAGFAASCCTNEVISMIVLVLGTTIGVFAGLVVDAFQTRRRHTERLIGRQYARSVVCPRCDHRFDSIQSIGQCPKCDTLFGSGDSDSA